MIDPIHQRAHETRAMLANAAVEARQHVEDTLMTPRFDCGRAEAVLERVRELKEQFVRGLSELCVVLDDGRYLLRAQLEVLKAFAAHNELAFDLVLSRISINNAHVVSANLSACGLTTLKELDGVWSLRKLILNYNPGLKSLKGIPTRGLEELGAADCGLAGDLWDLAHTSRLKKIWIFENRGITSLEGLPLKSIEEIYAGECHLRGDLSELSEAEQLKTLHLLRNRTITSLKGVSLKSIEHIHANACNLTGDHTFLSEARHLKTLVLDDNATSLTLDTTRFSDLVRLCF